MGRGLLLGLLLCAPAAHAARLLDGAGLLLAQLDPPPSLSEQPELAPEDALQTPSEQQVNEVKLEGAPSVGPVLGYMITGAALCQASLSFLLIALSSPTSAALFAIVALAHAAVGVGLLIKGNTLRTERNKYLEEQGITRAPAGDAPLLALSF